MDTPRDPSHTVWRTGADSGRGEPEVPDWYASPAEFGVEPGEESYVLWTGAEFVVALSRRPYNPGHLHLVPRTGATSYRELGEERLRLLGTLVDRSIGWIERALDPDGVNVGFESPATPNDRIEEPGRTREAGPRRPFYVHVIPRWSGDTNFTVTVHRTRVLPESLEETYRRLRTEILSASSPDR